MIDKTIEYLTYCFFLLVPLSCWKVKFHGIPVSVDFIIASLIILFFLIKVLYYNSFKSVLKQIREYIMSDKIGKLIIVYILVSILSFIKSINIGASIGEILRFLSYIILSSIIIISIKDKKTVHRILVCSILACYIVSVFGIIQYFTGIGLDKAFNTLYGFGTSRRVASTMFNPNNYAAFIMLFCYPVLLSALYIDNKRIKVFLFILFGLLTVNLILTFSRGAWLGFILGLIVLALIYNKKILRLIFIPVPLLLVQSIRNRFISIFSLTSKYNISRIKIWGTGLKMIEDNPILGVGLGNSIYLYDKYVEKYPELNTGHSMYPLHNSFLKILAETGIFNFIIFLMIIYFIMLKVYKIYESNRYSILKGISGGFFISLTGYIFMNFFDNCFFDPQTAVFFWLNFAVVIAYKNVLNAAVLSSDIESSSYSIGE